MRAAESAKDVYRTAEMSTRRKWKLDENKYELKKGLKALSDTILSFTQFAFSEKIVVL